MKTVTKFLIGAGIGLAGYGIYNWVKSNSFPKDDMSTRNLPVPSIDSMQQASQQETIAKRKGDLQVSVSLNANSVEKAFANKTSLINDILKAAKKIGSQLPNQCPGAPALLGDPRAQLIDTPQGFKAIITWAAMWKGTETGPVRSVVKECITNLVKSSDEQINSRFAGIEARRINSYA
jgi:hypothetical protein